MRLLLDESLSPRLGDLLRAAGPDAIHARDVGLMSAGDPVVLAAALQDRRVLLTLDTDFGALLALSGARQPSVVLFRGEVTRRPEDQARLPLANLDQIATELVEGAAVVTGDETGRRRTVGEGDPSLVHQAADKAFGEHARVGRPTRPGARGVRQSQLESALAQVFGGLCRPLPRDRKPSLRATRSSRLLVTSPRPTHQVWR